MSGGRPASMLSCKGLDSLRPARILVNLWLRLNLLGRLVPFSFLSKTVRQTISASFAKRWSAPGLSLLFRVGVAPLLDSLRSPRPPFPLINPPRLAGFSYGWRKRL